MVTLRPRTLLSLVLSLLLVAGGGVSANSVDIFAVDYAIVAYVVASVCISMFVECWDVN